MALILAHMFKVRCFENHFKGGRLEGTL